MRRKLFFFWAILCVIPSYSSGQGISFRGLGGLPGGGFTSIATAISADGSVVVGDANSGGESRAFHWTDPAGMVALGDLPGGPTYNVAGSGKSVSADGNIVTGYGGSSNAQAEAFRWTAATGMVGLGALEPGGFHSVAWGISADGSTVVGYAQTATSNTRAFRWTSVEGMVPLSGTNAGESIARAASFDGSVIAGYKTVGNNVREAFRWTAQDGAVGLGFLPNTFTSDATAMTTDGSVIVGTSTSSTGTRGFRWTANDGMVEIGDLGTGSIHPMAVSDDGNVIVGGASGGAFVWINEHGIFHLKQGLEFLGVDLTGWHLSQARAVSADGKIVAGFGISPRSGEEAWIVVIPEPSTVVLAAFGAAGVACLNRITWRSRRAPGS